MKKLLACLILGLVASSLHAQPAVGSPDYDPFNYTVAANLAGSPTGTPAGQENSQGLFWYGVGPTADTSQPKIASGTMNYPGLSPDSVNSVSFGGPVGISARFDLGTTAAKSTFLGSTAQTLYYSMLIDLTSLGTLATTGGFVCGFNTATGASTTAPTVFGAELTMRSIAGSSTTYNFGITKSGGAGNNTVWAPGIYNVGQTYFVVAEYAFTGTQSGNDIVTLWVDPPATSFGAPIAPASTTAPSSTNANIQTGSESIESFVFRQNNATEPLVTVSALRIGLDWADVTPIFAITSVSLSGINLTACWESVPGVVYDVLTNETVLGPNTTWSDAGSSSTPTSPVTATGTTTCVTVPFPGITEPYNIDAFVLIQSP